MGIRPLDVVEVLAGAMATLEQHGVHGMFMGLTTALAAGASVPATLVFERAGRVEVEFKVEAREPAEHAGH
jgi:copper(I)-binding protein